MAIGTTIVDSIAVVGTTVHSLEKAGDGLHQDLTVVNSNGDVIPVVLTMRASRIAGSMRSINLVLRHRPAAFDGILGASQGQITCSAQITGTIGENISQTDMRTFTQYLASVLCQSSIIDALLAGSTE